jgi:hypothetical protein
VKHRVCELARVDPHVLQAWIDAADDGLLCDLIV